MIGIKTVTVLYSSFCKVQKGGFLTGLDCIQGLKWGFPGGLVGKESACNAGDPDSIPGLGWSPGKGNGNPLQYSYLENPINREAWRGTVHGISKSQTGLSDRHFYFQGLRWSSLPIWMRLPGPLILSQVVLLLFPPRVEHDLATKPPTFLWLATVLPFGTERRPRRLSLAYDKLWTKKPLCPGIPQGPAACLFLVTQSCPTLRPHGLQPGSSSVLGIFPARILEWIAISFSRESSQPRDWIRISCLAAGFFTTEPPGKHHLILYIKQQNYRTVF